MGVFYGLIMLGMGFWFHHSVIQMNQSRAESEKVNAIQWFWIGAATFLGGLALGYVINWAFVEGILGGIDIGVGSGMGRTSGGNTGIQGVVLELVPLISGLVVTYLIRMRFVLKKELGIGKFVKKYTAKTK